MPLEANFIAEAVYASSTTMDCRHFAEEFVRRKKLADKGVVEKAAQLPSSESLLGGKNGGSSSGGGGWSEVAKKGGNSQKDAGNESIPGSQFKVVPGRNKKGGKK
jgi:PERQ amino acid-rich with GYF domain-containing protein